MSLSKLTKNQTGFVFLFVYLLTMIVGFALYLVGISLSIPAVALLFVVDVVMTLIIFGVGSIIKNASLYDPYWSVIPLFFILIYIPIYGTFTDFKNILLIIAITVWSIRLTYNWWKNWKGFEEQDWRYDMLKEKNKKIYPLTNLMGIHMIPTIVVYLQMICVFEIVVYGTLNFGYYVGFLMSLAAPVIQWFADKQMYDFRLNNKGKKKVINTGLWRFSRHPNYFGELLFWVGIYAMYLFGSQTFNFFILLPLSMIALFVFVSVPMMEKKLINRPGYKEYKEHVSMIIPFFSSLPKEEDARSKSNS